MGQGHSFINWYWLSLTFEDDIAPLFHEEGGGNTVFDGINLTFSADSAFNCRSLRRFTFSGDDTTDGAADGNRR